MLIDLPVPFPSAAIQQRLWVRHLPPHLHLDPDLSIESIVKTYSLSCASIIATTDELSRFDRVHARGGIVDNDISAGSRSAASLTSWASSPTS